MTGREIDNRLDRPMEDHIIDDEHRSDIAEEIRTQIENGEISNHDEVYFVMDSSIAELIAEAFMNSETVNFRDPVFNEWRNKATDRLVEVGTAQEIEKIKEEQTEFLERA